jgi:hypothetical protein
MAPTPIQRRACPGLWPTHRWGTSLIRKRPPPWDPHMALGMFLLQGPTRGLLLTSEVLLHWKQATPEERVLYPRLYLACEKPLLAYTSLVRNSGRLGPYGSPMLRGLW